MKHQGQVPADPEADFELFDRVVNVRTLGVAPYGLKGTIVGIHQGTWNISDVIFLPGKLKLTIVDFEPTIFGLLIDLRN